MRILIVTNLFPNRNEPNRSTFNFQQFCELSKLCEIKILAPVPFFKYSLQQLPLLENFRQINVYHPRYLVIPKILRFTHGLTLFLGIWQTLKKIYVNFKYDAILAAWGYPDAVGAAIAAKILKKKLYIKVHGTDINDCEKYFLRKQMIIKALHQSQKVIAVSCALKEKLVSWGIGEEKIVVLPNGIDKEKFYPKQKQFCREKLGLKQNQKHILYVGNFAPVKGVEYLIRAFSTLKGRSNLKLLLIGAGEEKNKLMELAGASGVSENISFLGRKSHDDIAEWMNAADVLCLPSLNEGCPNVVLESLACGTPVVASGVGSVPQTIKNGENGFVSKPGDYLSLSIALDNAVTLEWDQSKVAATVQAFSWEENARRLLEIFTNNEGRGTIDEGR